MLLDVFQWQKNLKIKLLTEYNEIWTWSPGFPYIFWHQLTLCVNALSLVFVDKILFDMRKLQTRGGRTFFVALGIIRISIQFI